MKSENKQNHIEEIIVPILQEIRSLLIQDLEFRNGDEKKAYIEGSELRQSVMNLCDGTKNVSELTEKTGKLQPAVSSTISDLYERGLLRIAKKEGRETYYITVPR
jgi:DNA-binding transcriptional ArsR family regulator